MKRFFGIFVLSLLLFSCDGTSGSAKTNSDVEDTDDDNPGTNPGNNPAANPPAPLDPEDPEDPEDDYYTTPEYIRLVFWPNEACRAENVSVQITYGSGSTATYTKAGTYPLTVKIGTAQMAHQIQMLLGWNSSATAAAISESMYYRVYTNKGRIRSGTVSGSQFIYLNNLYTYDHYADVYYHTTDFSCIGSDLLEDSITYAAEWENMTTESITPD